MDQSRPCKLRVVAQKTGNAEPWVLLAQCRSFRRGRHTYDVGDMCPDESNRRSLE